MKSFSNITVNRIAAPGDESLAIDPGKITNVFDALTRILKAHNIFDSKGKACGVANNFRLDGSQITADAELSRSEPSGKFALSILLGGMSGKAAYQSGRLAPSDVAHLVIVPDTSVAVRFSREIAKTARSTGNASGCRFAGVVNDYANRGFANPFAKAVISHPDLYNEYRNSFGGQTGATHLSAKRVKDETQISAGDVAIMHAEIRAISRLSQGERGAAVIKLARTNPKAYNAARARGLI